MRLFLYYNYRNVLCDTIIYEVIVIESDSRLSRRQDSSSGLRVQRRHPFFNFIWAIVLVAFATTLTIKSTVLSPKYVAQKVEQTSVMKSLATEINDDLNGAGVSQNLVTTGMVSTVFKTEVKSLLSGEETTDQTNQKIEAQFQQLVTNKAKTAGVDNQVSKTLVKTVANDLAKRFETKIQQKLSAYQNLYFQVNQYNFYLGVASVILTILMAVISILKHHFWRSLGPALFMAGILIAGLGVTVIINLPSFEASASQFEAQMMSTVGESSIVTLAFVGVMTGLVGLIVMLGHRVFRKS